MTPFKFSALSLRFFDAVIDHAKHWDRLRGEPEPLPPLPPLKRESIKEILIFKPDEIGDAVVALPALAALREYFRAAKVTVICQAKAQAVYENSGLIDQVIPVRVKTRALRFVSFDLPAALAAVGPKKVDLAVFLRTYPAYFSQFKQVPAGIHLHPRHRNMSSDSPYQISLGDPRQRSQAEQLLDLVQGVTGVSAPVRFPEFKWTADDQNLPMELPKDYFVLHPFNKYETKRYPYWPELARKIQAEFNLPLVLIGGPEDGALDIPEAIALQGKLKLGQTGYVLKNARAFIGNESGPGHWAAAMGTPTVSLMGGHSSPAEWGTGKDSFILQAEVPCSPCHRRVCPGKGLICLTRLTPDAIWPQIRSYLGATRPK